MINAVVQPVCAEQDPASHAFPLLVKLPSVELRPPVSALQDLKRNRVPMKRQRLKRAAAEQQLGRDRGNGVGVQQSSPKPSQPT